MVSKFVPNFVTQGVIDHDYTMLAMRRFAEISSYYWTSIIRKIKTQNMKVIEELSSFQKGDLKQYKEVRRTYDAAQSRYDSMLSKYMGLSKNKEPSALREDAFQLAETRTTYFKASFELANTLSMTQSKLDVCLVKALAEPWVLSPSEFTHSDPIFQKVSVEMTRLLAWARAMSKDYKPLLKQLSSAGKEVERKALEKFQPSRDLNDYTPQMSTITRFNNVEAADRKLQTEKHGWVFVRSASKTRVTWVRRWIFVKNSMFGWFNIALSKTYVQESDKVGVLLCHVTPITTEDRRFCFEIKTTEHTFVCQAQSRAELMSWLQVFEDSKNSAVNGSKQSNIAYAFQRIPPPITEFASTSNTTVDMELHDMDSPTSPQTNFPSRSLFSDSETNNLREIMTAGETLDSQEGKTSEKHKVNFITIGPFGSSLVSSPLINSPMATSRSLEAILANSLMNTTTLPTAITANYWGSINWAVYQRDKMAQKTADTVPVSRQNTDESMASSSTKHRDSEAHLFVDRYPHYYPLELRSQDAQLRALFQNMIPDNDQDRVVLAFRCLAKPTPHFEITSRAFVTPTHVCLYSHCAGFTITGVFNLNELISVESRQSLSCDTLYMISKQGTSTVKVFLDSGRLLQKRLLFLIDNSHSSKPLGLKEIIEKLTSIGTDQQEDQLDQYLMIGKEPPSSIDEIRYIQEAGQKYETQLRQFYLREDKAKAKESTVDLADGIASEKISSRSKSITKMPNGSNSSLRNSLTQFTLSDSDYADLIRSELEQSMSQLSVESSFDIPAKALFHIMFGELSDVFFFPDTTLVLRDEFEVTPWKVTGSTSRLEREIHYHITDKGTFSGEISDRVMTLQRVERMNDRCYIVYERGALWTLPQSSFYTTSRYVIFRTGKNTSQLCIYNGVEWIKSTVIKNMAEPFILSKLKAEAKIILHRVAKARQQLGSKGGTMTAIRMFGKLGKSLDQKNLDINTRSLKNTEQCTEMDAKMNTNKVHLSQKSLIKSLLEIFGSFVASLIGDTFIVMRRIWMTIIRSIFSNRWLILLFIASCLFNVFLIGRSTKEYWQVRDTSRVIEKIGMIPTDQTMFKRSIYLADLDDIIRNGSTFSGLTYEGVVRDLAGSKDTFTLKSPRFWTPPGVDNGENGSSRTTLCYSKFRNLALEPANFDSTFVESPIVAEDVLPRLLGRNLVGSSARERIHAIRARMGISRNELLIELRTLNRLERELIEAEWRTWLFDEVRMCTRLYTEFAQALVEKTTNNNNNNGNNHDGDTSSEEGRHNLLNKVPRDVKHALYLYCGSCLAEHKHNQLFGITY